MTTLFDNGFYCQNYSYVPNWYSTYEIDAFENQQQIVVLNLRR